MREPLEALLAACPAPAASAAFFERMLADIVGGGGAADVLEKVRCAGGRRGPGAVHVSDTCVTWQAMTFMHADTTREERKVQDVMRVSMKAI